ncbi:hypothetical protein I3F58_28480 [Streptomyces sp. MUM 203J]|uniref:hypothetical protein n=1 Tax=Streptomyces sp. MUM 203J TaxID=2791990 RepID=UPI001F044BBC|nr:hypothetical protein [Streptomyces sp. MUM 203J]MCH0543416.1 hypothetical protein [Streptomyces sp. MUM 203J]
MSEPTRTPGDVNVTIPGEGSVGIGYVHLLKVVLGGDWREVATGVKRWSGWNWPQFFLVLVLDVTALFLAPDGPLDRLGWLYAAMATALLLSFCRVSGAVGTLAERAGNRLTYLPSLVSVGCVLLATTGIVGMQYYAAHGEVDVTGRARIKADAPLTDGGRLTVTVGNAPHRSRLRLTLELSDAAPGAQSCVPATTYDARLKGSGADRVEGVRSGQAFSLPLGGIRGEAQVEAVLHTDTGCRMGVSVAEAALHD